MTTLNNVVLVLVAFVLASFVGSVVPVPFVSDDLSVVVEAQDRGNAYNCAEVVWTSTSPRGITSFRITNRCEYDILVHYTVNGELPFEDWEDVRVWNSRFRVSQLLSPGERHNSSFYQRLGAPAMVWCAERPRGFDTLCRNPRGWPR